MSDPRYRTARWRHRRQGQLTEHPLCAYCLARGLVVAANVADHKIPHRGDDALFWEGELQSLCAPCHDRHKQREETHGFASELDADGWPADPRHPANATQHAAAPRKRPSRMGRGGVVSAAMLSLTGGCLFLALPHNSAPGVENAPGVNAVGIPAAAFGGQDPAELRSKSTPKPAENAPKLQENAPFSVKSAPFPLNSGEKREPFAGQA